MPEEDPTGDCEASTGDEASTDGEDSTGGGEDPDAGDETQTGDNEEIPAAAVDRAETLTRRAREAVDDAERTAYLETRDELLDDHDYVGRVRDDGDGETLVVHPAEWLEDGLVRVDRIEDTGRAEERSLSGPGDGDWDAVEAHNRAVAERVEASYGEAHGANASAFADFMSNHYVKSVEAASRAEREEFLAEYFPRNAWPTDAQRDAVERSLRLVAEAADAESGTSSESTTGSDSESTTGPDSEST